MFNPSVRGVLRGAAKGGERAHGSHGCIVFDMTSKRSFRESSTGFDGCKGLVICHVGLQGLGCLDTSLKMLDGNTVPLLVKTIVAAKHERRHGVQYIAGDLLPIDGFEDVARWTMASRYSHNWYASTYFANVAESDATVAGVRDGRDFARRFFTAEEVDAAICDMYIASVPFSSLQVSRLGSFRNTEELLDSMLVHREDIAGLNGVPLESYRDVDPRGEDLPSKLLSFRHSRKMEDVFAGVSENMSQLDGLSALTAYVEPSMIMFNPEYERLSKSLDTEWLFNLVDDAGRAFLDMMRERDLERFEDPSIASQRSSNAVFGRYCDFPAMGGMAISNVFDDGIADHIGFGL